MAMLLKGAPVAAALSNAAEQDAQRLRARGVVPCLAIVRVGAREDTLSYERGAAKRCSAVGVEVRPVVFPEDIAQETLLSAVTALGRDETVHGILLLRPLPAGLDEAAVCAAIPPEKDVDGITPGAMGSLYAGLPGAFAPCTAQACLEILKYYNVPLAGRRAVVVGRSLAVGKGAAMLLLSENATVTICHSKTADLAELCREADILLVAAGQMGLIGRECLKEGQTVLDVGIHMGQSGLCGDVRQADALEIVDAITPVPGGVGAVTSAVIAAHTVRAAMRMRG